MSEEARTDDLELSLTWQKKDGGGLVGVVTARNVSERPVHMSSKPVIEPLDPDGRPVGVGTVVTLDYRPPVEIAPGATARSHASWGGWDGADPGDEAIVQWSGGEQRIRVLGPTRPVARGTVRNISTGWFVL